MTLTEIRYLVMLAKEKHFGRAAQRSHVSQPTLSVAIHKLEEELGVILFERDRSEVRVTEIGEAIIAQGKRVLDEATQLKEIASAKKSQLNMPLRIGAIYTLGPYVFPQLITHLKKIAPQMPLIIQEDFTGNLRTKLVAGELDVILISLPFSEAGVVTKGLYDEPFVVLLPKQHPLCKKDKITARDLTDETILLLGEGHCFRKQVLDACPDCFTSPHDQRGIEGTSLDTLRHMVASGMGVTVLPSSATQIQYYKSVLAVKPFAGKVPQRRIALAWRASFTRPKAITALMAALKQSQMEGVCLVMDK